MELLERLELTHPVVQAGMGGGTSGAELAGAVSAAGGLGTVGIMLDPASMRAEIVRARGLAAGREDAGRDEGAGGRVGAAAPLGAGQPSSGGPPVAANLLVPFAKPAHVEACIEGGARCVVLFCGFAPKHVLRLKEAGVFVLHQVGTVPEAKRALADGADGLIAQGREAGGHLLGAEPSLDFLPRTLEVAQGRPVLLAGGIATAHDVRRALDAGAAAAVAGTRFLLTEECAAHPAYKRRVLDATETVETLLFSLAWHERHRVVPNQATERWCRRRSAGGSHADSAASFGPKPVLAFNRLTAPLLRRLPPSASIAAMRTQRPGVPFYGPASLLEGMDERLVEATPLYAGETAMRIDAIVPAAQAVRDLAP